MRLLQHGVPLEGTETLHEVVPEPGTLLSATTKAGPLACSSHHHQGVDRVGDGLVVTGRSRDGLVEAIELPRSRRERRRADHVDARGPVASGRDGCERSRQQALFDVFVNLARWRGQLAHPGEPLGAAASTASRNPTPLARAVRGGGDPDPRRPFHPTSSRIDHVGSTSVPRLPRSLRRHPALDHLDRPQSRLRRPAARTRLPMGRRSLGRRPRVFQPEPRARGRPILPDPCLSREQRLGGTAPRVPRRPARRPLHGGRVRTAEARARRRAPERHLQLRGREDALHPRGRGARGLPWRSSGVC